MDKLKWLRVKNGNKYGYVKVNSENKPIEFNKNTGQFKVYYQPNNKSHFFETSLKSNEEILRDMDISNNIRLWGDLDEIIVTPLGVFLPEDYNANNLFKAALQAERNKEIARNKAIDAKVSQYAFTPEGFFDVATGPAMKLLSPTNTTRALWDIGKGVLTGEGPGNIAQRLFTHNNGWFSDDFAREHPYLTMAGNMLGDVATFGTVAALRGMPKYRTMLLGLVEQNYTPLITRSSRLSEAERLGLPKHVRKDLLTANPSGESLHSYYNLLDRLQSLADTRRKLHNSSKTVLELLGVKDGGYSSIIGGSATKDGFDTYRGISFGRGNTTKDSYGMNLHGAATRRKDLYPNSSKIVFEGAAKNDWNAVVTETDVQNTKKAVLRLIEAMKRMGTGSEFSGDAKMSTPAEKLSMLLLYAKQVRSNPKAYREAIKEAKTSLLNLQGVQKSVGNVYDAFNGITTINAGMSPDAYSFIYRTANSNPSKFHISYGSGNAGPFNSIARHPKNSYMYLVELDMLNGKITPKQYINEYNKWITPLGGRRAYIYEGSLQKPQPFIVRNKLGGDLK